MEYGLQRKLPYLTLVNDLRLEFLPDSYFDVVHAHSVFSHSPLGGDRRVPGHTSAGS